MSLVAPSFLCGAAALPHRARVPAGGGPFPRTGGGALHAPAPAPRARVRLQGGGKRDGAIEGNPYDKAGRSPGAGASTSDEQADAAYADLLFTSMVGGDEDAEPQGTWEEALEEAKKGDTSSGWQDRKSKGGISDVLELFRSLAGGAHIVRGKDGRV